MNHLIFEGVLLQNDTYSTKPTQNNNNKKRITVKHITGLIHAHTHTHTHTHTDKALQTPANPLTAKSQFSNQFSSIHAYK